MSNCHGSDNYGYQLESNEYTVRPSSSVGCFVLFVVHWSVRPRSSLQFPSNRWRCGVFINDLIVPWWTDGSISINVNNPIWYRTCNLARNRQADSNGTDHLEWHQLGGIGQRKCLSFWWNFHHWLQRKLSKWQLPVQPMMKISSKWRHCCFSARIHGSISYCCLAHFTDDFPLYGNSNRDFTWWCHQTDKFVFHPILYWINYPFRNMTTTNKAQRNTVYFSECL